MEPNQTTQPLAAQTPGTNSQSTIDPTALALSRAIRSVESNGDYNAVGDNGQSHGAYQFNNDNFKNWATEQGLDPNDMSEQNQDHVAYNRIEGLLKQGVPPSQVAAIWNGAKYENGQYQAINPEYVDKVKNAYQQQSGGQGGQSGSQLAPGVPALQLNSDNGSQSPSNESSQPQEPSLGSELIGRTNDASTAISNTMSGKINPLSGLIQVGGAAAGGLGDILNKGLELIPGVKQVEGLIGQGVGALAQTPVGQSVASSIKSFSAAHPELSADIGAGFNIATAIPIFDGLAAVKDVAMDGVAKALQSTAEKGFINDTADIITKTATKTGPAFLEKNPTVLRDMVDRRLIPSIGSNGTLQTGDAVAKSWSTITDANSQVKAALQGAKYTSVGEDATPILDKALSSYPNSEFTPTDILDNAKELTPQNSALWKKFEAGQASMADVNTLRSDLDQAVKSVYANTAQAPIKKDMGAQLASAMREFVQTNAPETQQAFQEMTKQFNIQKALKLIQGKSPQIGIGDNIVKDMATAGGEMAGNATGIPFAGAYGGNQAGSYVVRKFGGGALQRGILARTGVDAVTAAKGSLLKGLVKVGAGALAQKAVNK
jgi:hypothetical protein